MSLLSKRRSRSESRKDLTKIKDETNKVSIIDEDVTKRNQQHVQERGRHHHHRQRNPPTSTSLALTLTRSQQHLNNIGTSSLDSFAIGGSGGMGRRKTSAELISEAKIFLGDIDTPSPPLSNAANMIRNAATAAAANVGSQHKATATNTVGGVRLISTRRPITPREPGRVLYGKVALAGRPPSAFSMRYLQSQTPKTPPGVLEPIKTPTQQQHNKDNNNKTFDFNEFNVNDVSGGGGGVSLTTSIIPSTGGKLTNPRKLPALPPNTCKPKIAKDQLTSSSSSLSTTTTITTTSSSSPATRKMMLPTRHGDVLTQSNTETLIDMLKQHAGLKDCNDETVGHINAILIELYTRVRRHEKHYKRGFILGGLYGLVECTAPKILLAVARVVLALHVTGSNLTGACKLIFKVARHEQHDNLFHDNDLLELLIDGLGHASPLDDPEACIYGYGSIRFLTTSVGQERGETIDMHSDLINKNWSDCLDELPRKPATAPAADGFGNNISTSSNSSNFDYQKQATRFHKLNRQYTLVERLSRHGAVELMILHLQILNEAGASRRLTGPPLHSLYQLSAALRALADVRQTNDVIERELETKQQQRAASVLATLAIKRQATSPIKLELACPHLIRAAEVAMGELEVQANIVRTLSVLSEDPACCKVLSNCAARIGMLLGPCTDFNAQHSATTNDRLLSVLSRLGYILGNILAKHDSSRIQYYHNDVAMEYLINVLDVYSKAPLTLHNSQGDTVIDVLVKMIRVVANMSVNAEVGFGLGNTRSLGAVLLNLLNAHTVQNSHDVNTSEAYSKKMKSELQELLHATLGALHNLCFYQDKNTTPAQVIEAKGSLQSIISDLATGLCIALRTCPLESTRVEIARVLGNLTRNEKARRYFCRAGGLPLIVQHLTRNPMHDYDLKACAIGVLVNLLGDRENRSPFLQLKGCEVLTLLLRGSLEQEDWFLATIVCQAIWNLLIDAKCAQELAQNNMLDEVSDLLADHLDEERIFDNTNSHHDDISNENDNDYEGGNGGENEGGGGVIAYTDAGAGDAECQDAIWEDFAVVATDLLERIQTNFEKLTNKNKESSSKDHTNYSYDDDNQLRQQQRTDSEHDDDEDVDVFIEEM